MPANNYRMPWFACFGLFCGILALAAGVSTGAIFKFAGFAPAGQNLWTPLLNLGHPGCPQDAFATIDRMLPFDREILLNPLLSARLIEVETRLPPRQTTLIRAAELYADSSIPWQTQAPDVHFIAVEGRPTRDEYRYDLTTELKPPAHLGDFSSRFSLQPTQAGSDGRPASVIARLQGSIIVGSFSPDQALSVAAAALREIFGTLAPPWDTKAGDFNEHDRAALSRVARDMPALSEQLDRYLLINNLLDEFVDANGPYVLYNLDVQFRDEALADFPHFRAFYRSLTERVTGISVARDVNGRLWLRLEFANGHFRIIFMLRNGELTPFDEHLRPAGQPLALATVSAGEFRTDTSVWVDHFGMRFGLAHIRSVDFYRHRAGTVTLISRMQQPPSVLAPPLLHSVVLLIAGQFLQTLATGNSGQGMMADINVRPLPAGGTIVNDGFAGEFLYSPALELLASIGDRIAAANNSKVLADERALLGRFLSAAHRDYLRAQPALLAAATSRLASDKLQRAPEPGE